MSQRSLHGSPPRSCSGTFVNNFARREIEITEGGASASVTLPGKQSVRLRILRQHPENCLRTSAERQQTAMLTAKS